jgi:hypothetical protein
MSVALEATFKKLEGEYLTSVNFLQHYLQLHFEEPLLNIYTPITVVAFGTTTRSDNNGFRDALRGQIAKQVEAVSLVPSEALIIAFEDRAQLSISLRPDDYPGPQAVEARGLAEQWLAI